MKKLSELLNEGLDAPTNLRFLNDRARAHWALEYGTYKDFILLQTEDASLNMQFFTQEAFELLKGTLIGPISATNVCPSSAAQIANWVWTCEDVITYLQSRVQP